MPDWPLQRDCIKFYGDPRAPDFYEQNIWFVEPPFPMVSIDDNGNQNEVKKIPIHKECAFSLARVLLLLWEASERDYSKIIGFGTHVFSGAYVNRSMRDSPLLSMHAFGAAIDINSKANPYGGDAVSCLFDGNHPAVQAFKSEGWIWGGDWVRPRDAMHFQAARVR
jgi:hypothetical protein